MQLSDTLDLGMRIVITLLVIYPGLIFLLRVTGKRSLTKLNMFDFVITVAIGSVLASVIITESISILEGLLALALLLGAQYVVSWTSTRWSFMENLVKANPTIVFEEEDFLEDKMKEVRVTKAEVLAEIRQQGFVCLDDVYAVILETNGNMSVLGKKKETINRPTLADINEK